jgi:D-3-phosphoglycerate dehydrogenase
VDNVDVPTATRRGIVVVNSPEGNTIAAAEHALAMMLSLSRHIPAADKSVKAGEVEPQSLYRGRSVQKDPGGGGPGQNWGPCGHRCPSHGHEAAGLRSLYFHRAGRSTGLPLVDLDLLLREADYITLHLPKTPETANLINEKTLAYHEAHGPDY